MWIKCYFTSLQIWRVAICLKHTLLWLPLSRNLLVNLTLTIWRLLSPSSEIYPPLYLDPLSKNPGSTPGCNECFRCVFITQYICDRIWENVHNSHIRFFSFKDSENLVGTIYRSEICSNDRGMVVP